MALKGVLRGVRKEILYLADVALKSGAANVGKELANVTRGVNQPYDINLKTITSALRSGVVATGQELMTKGMERVRMPSQPQNSKVSEAEEATHTQPSKEVEQ